jgi:hypothetical protein
MERKTIELYKRARLILLALFGAGFAAFTALFVPAVQDAVIWLVENVLYHRALVNDHHKEFLIWGIAGMTICAVGAGLLFYILTPPPVLGSNTKEKWQMFFTVLFTLRFIIVFFLSAFGVYNGRSVILGQWGLFWDTWAVFKQVCDRAPYFYGGNYLPLANLILYPFSRFIPIEKQRSIPDWEFTVADAGTMGMAAALLFNGASLLFLFYALNKLRKKYCLREHILLGLLVSMIVMFAFGSGNLIVMTSGAVALFICYYDSDGKKQRIAAALALAFAATLKIFPVLLGFLYLHKKRYRDASLAAIITVILSFFPFVFFKGGFSNIPRLIQGLIGFVSTNREEFRYIFPHHSYIYLLIAAVSIALSFYTKDAWKKLAMLLFAVLWAGKSFTYVLLYFIPLLLLFFATLRARSFLFNGIIFITLSSCFFIRNFDVYKLALHTLWLVSVLSILSHFPVLSSRLLRVKEAPREYP